MSSHGGDKRLAHQLAYKVTALPRAAHTGTRSDSMHSLQLSCPQSCVRVCVCVSHSLTLVLSVLLQRLWSIQAVERKMRPKEAETRMRKEIPVAK